MTAETWMYFVIPGTVFVNTISMHGVVAIILMIILNTAYFALIGWSAGIIIGLLLRRIFGRDEMREFASRKPFVTVAKQMQIAIVKDWLSCLAYSVVFILALHSKRWGYACSEKATLVIITVLFTLVSAYRHEFVLKTEATFIKLRSLSMIPFAIFFVLISLVVLTIIFPGPGGVAPHFARRWTDSLFVFFPSLWGLVIKATYEFAASKISKTMTWF